jgi:hyperosmotically inducible periplasmic protein
MMNPDSTHKIVVGVVLATAFSVGVSTFAIRTQHENEAARNAPTPAPAAAAEQNAPDTAAPIQNASAQTPSDPAAVASAAPPAAPPVVAPTPNVSSATAASNTIKDGSGALPNEGSSSAKSKAADHADRRAARARSSAEGADTRLASNSSSSSPPEQTTSSSADSVRNEAPIAATGDSPQASVQTGQEAANGTGSGMAPAAVDSQITAEVKSEIAAAAPNSAVDVTTSNGVVALAGSVSSQDAADQASQAAQRVAGVKHVDASALMVSNQ